MSNNLYGNFRQRKFSDIYPDVDTFKNGYKGSGLYSDIAKITDDRIITLYYLLYAKYGNSTIASSDENQFKYKLYATIFEFGPTWEKNLVIQNDLRSLSADELMTGSRQINNHSYNPSTEPSTSSLTELTTINEQNTTGYKKSKMDAYALLTALLDTDVTEQFISRFKKLFLVIVEPEEALWYITDNSEDII